MPNEPKSKPWFSRGAVGQSLVEYALIATLVIGALIIALLATGPVIGNVFSSVIFATLGESNVSRPTVENGPTAFWLTVTWVATQTPQETPYPTNEPFAVPTDVPMGWEPPTDVPLTPSNTPPPTNTVAPSPTPRDLNFEVPFNDLANEPEWYRIVDDIYLGQQAWKASYWKDKDSEGTVLTPFSNPEGVTYRRAFDPNASHFVDPIETDLPGMDEQWFSARYTRDIYVYGTEPVRVGFRMDDPSGGLRVFYNDNSSCSNYRPDTDNRNTLSTSSSCLILDEWKNAPAAERLVYHTFQPGPSESVPAKYTIYVETYQQTGGANFELDIISPKLNPDDAGTNAAPVNCNWGQYTGDRTNTRTHSWNSAVGLDEFPDNQVCYLELRGYIDLQSTGSFTLTDPVMRFWHIWDLNNATTVELQVANYDTSLPEDSQSRPANATDWQTVWSPSLSNTRNYEWTPVEVDLTSSGFNVGDTITYRFVIDSTGSNGGRKRWYVDDISIGNRATVNLANINPVESDTFTVCTTPDKSCASFWDLNSEDQKDDFYTTGRWQLTSNRARNGLSWEDDAGNAYSLEEGANLNGSDGQIDQRVYWIEFAKRINVTNTSDNGLAFNATPEDPDGDKGAPVLTFYQAYSLKDNAKLEIQYFDDTRQTWRLLRTIIKTGNSGQVFRNDVHYVEVPLNLREVADANGNGTGIFEDAATDLNGDGDVWDDWYQQPIRVRFAMTVNENAIAASSDVSWSIDDILIERLGDYTFTPYPLYESAGDGEGKSASLTQNLWVRTGLWDITSFDKYSEGQFSFTDSPSGNYIAGSDSRIELRSPIDLYSNTPSNPFAQNCDATLPSVGECETTRQVEADDPVLSFWWYRDLANAHRFIVEITPKGGVGTPVTVWEYNYNSDDATQTQWERAEIALKPFLVDDGSDDFDDILVSFRLDATANSSSNGDGIYLDEIRIEEPNNPTFMLWSGSNGGNGQRYLETIDERTLVPGETYANSNVLRWWERWHLGGSWFALNTTDYFEPKSGVLAMHDSDPMSPDPFDPANSFRYETNSFYTLEMIRHIDLTGVNTVAVPGDPTGYQTGGADASPVMYWWQRADKGTNARMRVQISEKLSSPPAQMNQPLTYGDDELYGWTEWKNVYVSSNSTYREYQWVREGVNLQHATIYNDNGNSTGTIEDFSGSVIRVRFVLDANDTVNSDDARDGWFIDDIEFTTMKPRIYALPFTDNASDMDNWIGEGTWGLDVELYRGGSGLPPLGGDDGWTVKYLNCTWRPNINPISTANRRNDCNTSRYNDMLTNMDYRATMVDPNDPSGVNADERWYMTDYIASLLFDYDYNRYYNSNPPDAPVSYGWENYFTAEFQREIEVYTPYRYQFYVRADDGVRVGLSPYPSTSEVQRFTTTQNDVNIPTASNFYIDPSNGRTTYYNNVINAWRYQGPTVYKGTVTLVPNQDFSPRRYLVTVQYFEQGGGAVIAFGMSGASASFSDSPMLVPSNNIADREPVNYYSNTSLILDGLLDLRASNAPVINYYALHEIDDVSSTGYLEVSTDGGFTWTQDNLRDRITVNGTQFDARSNTSFSYNRTDWEERLNTLDDYTGRLISLRFRLDVNASKDTVETRMSQNNKQWNGLNISDILIFDLNPPSPDPQIVTHPEANVVDELDKPITLTVTASGQAPLRYEWYKGQRPTDPNNPTENGATMVFSGSNSYTPPTDTVGTNQYWVRVQNNISDNNASINPVISELSNVTVVSCLPKSIGDCGQYRINVGGYDEPSTDGSVPSWSGDRESASAYQNLSGWNNNTTQITIPSSHASPLVMDAINGSAPEVLYERSRVSNDFNWTLPVPEGTYTIRLYMAERDNNSNINNRDQERFVATVNGNPVRYVNDSSSAFVNNVSISELIAASGDDWRRVGAILEFEPVAVSAAQGQLDIVLTAQENDGGKNIYIAGLEVFPVLDNAPQIIRQPNDRNVATGDDTQIAVQATGKDLAFNWYRGNVGDTSNPITTGVTNVTAGMSATSTLSLTNINAEASYWARVSSTDPAITATEDSQASNITLCLLSNPTPGSCNRWFINVGGDNNNTPTANDGTVWVAEYSNRNEPWASTASNNREPESSNGPWKNVYDYVNIDLNHVPQELFRTRSSSSSDYSWTLPVDPGVYDITLYFADNDNNQNRRFNILIEGQIVEDGPTGAGFNMREAAGVDDTPYKLTFSDVSIADNDVRIDIDHRSGWAAQVTAIEVVPSS